MTATTLVSKRLTLYVLMGLVFGIGFGVILNLLITHGIYADLINKYIVSGLLTIIGSIFINILKFVIAPIVFFSLLLGITRLNSLSSILRLGVKTVVLVVITTAAATTIAIYAASLVDFNTVLPMNIQGFDAAGAKPGFSNTVIDLFPKNLLQPFLESNILQVITFSIISGVVLVKMQGDYSKKILEIAELAESFFMNLITIVMNLAPFAVFALLAKSFASQGLSGIVPLLKYASTLTSILLGYTLLLVIVAMLSAGLSPVKFLKKVVGVASIAFSTSSSNATLPVTLEVAEQRLGISKMVAGFVIPIGATINMNGTAIMQGVAVVFISGLYGIDLTIAQYMGVVALTIVAAIGTAGVPGVGLLMLSLVLQQYNIPLEGIAFILGVDRILDMIRTATNVLGDMVIATVIAKSEKELDISVFNSD